MYTPINDVCIPAVIAIPLSANDPVATFGNGLEKELDFLNSDDLLDPQELKLNTLHHKPLILMAHLLHRMAR